MPLPLSFRQEGDCLHYNGDYHRRRRGSGTDVDVCFGGKIAVTEMRLF
jgi:5'-nucleotidase